MNMSKMPKNKKLGRLKNSLEPRQRLLKEMLRQPQRKRNSKSSYWHKNSKLSLIESRLLLRRRKERLNSKEILQKRESSGHKCKLKPRKQRLISRLLD